MEPGNQPWEQPPLYSDNNQAIAFHLKNFNKEDKMEDLLFLMEQGAPLQGLVESVMTMGVMHGVHTLDTSTLISPVIHQYLKESADAAGIKYKEWNGPTPEQKKAMKDKERLQVMLGNSNLTSQERVPTEAPVSTPVAEEPVAKGFIKRKV
jgi:hypothetical protein